jgi:hypothetical protein
MKVKSAMKSNPAKRSKSEIRAMLEKKVEQKNIEDQAKLSNKAKAMAKKGSRVDPDKSALGLNDPNSPATHEKLKSALKSGAVNFSPMQKKVLSKILNS